MQKQHRASKFAASLSSKFFLVHERIFHRLTAKNTIKEEVLRTRKIFDTLKILIHYGIESKGSRETAEV